ncbi:LLM class flavin-dependent oxidoreductase [bacterium]|nr:LLM class flavin-dependent oxidoreductase [bacterium]
MAQISEDKLIETMRNEIKGYIRMRGYTYESLAKILTKKYGKSVSAQSINNKLSRGSIKYIDVIKIATALEYKITWS